MRLIDADAMRENLLWCKEQSGSYDNYWDDVIERLDAQPTVDGWISVKDRLPEKSGTYLCYQADAADFMRIHTYRWSEVKENWMGCQIGSVITRITHWRPLPEPPEEEMA